MENPAFEIVEHRFGTPFRTRVAYKSYVFSQAADLAIYITPQVAGRARHLAREALPRETGGLLGGRILRDDDGPYLVLTTMADAPPAAGDRGTFNLSPAETESLRRDLAARSPTADVVGWWHSHSRPSRYSQTDRENQSIWMDPNHIGLLVFAEGPLWADIYLGPEGRGPFRAGKLAEQPVAGNPAPQPAHPADQPPPGDAGPAMPITGMLTGNAKDKPYPALRWITIAAIAVIGLIIGALALRALTPSAQVVHSYLNRYLAWSCVVSTTGVATCHADTTARVEWLRSGARIGAGPTISFALGTSGETAVQVIVTGPFGNYTDEQLLVPPAGK